MIIMRIISLAPSNTEILFALGLGSEIIARTAYCDYPEQTKEIPKIGDWIKPDIKKIKKLNADLILTSTVVQEKLAAKLKKQKLPIAHLAPRKLNEVLQSIEKIGELVNKKEEAKKIVNGMLLKFADIRKNADEFSYHPRIYVEEWHKPPFVSGNWVPELAEIAGGKYGLVKAGEYSRKIELKEIQEFDPEIIILSICGVKSISKEMIKKRKGWQSLSAIKNNQIHVFDDSFLNRPGSRLVHGCRMITEIIEKYLKK